VAVTVVVWVGSTRVATTWIGSAVPVDHSAVEEQCNFNAAPVEVSTKPNPDTVGVVSAW
jgi:hypothetical protein